MLSRERVMAAIRRQPVDRIPLYGWVAANLGEAISERFGSVRAFEDRYAFDYAHLFGGPSPFNWDDVRGKEVEPAEFLEMPLTDPNDMAAYAGLQAEVAYHQGERGRFVYVQTPGIFECLNGVFGIENHLAYLLLYEEELHEVYRRQAAWNRAFAMNCLDLGIDMIHVSDDWGAQAGLIFSPEVWWRMIYPYHKVTADAVKAHGAFLSLHSDGNINQVLDGIVQLGYDVLHPYQESAGMDYGVYQARYADQFVIMGGLDVQTTIGFGTLDVLQAEIERVLRTFAGGGLLFCTSHFVQAHCSIEELTFAYDLAYRLVREVKMPVGK